MNSSEYKVSNVMEEQSLRSLSVYNVGRQKCSPGHSWGPGVRNHYLIHHVIAGRGCYQVAGVTYRLRAGDTFLIYPELEVLYYADYEEPWEYAWVGFNGTEALPLLRATDFTKSAPCLYQKLPTDLITAQMMDIYRPQEHSLAQAVAMTGSLYTLLSTLIGGSSKAALAKSVTPDYVDTAIAYILTTYSYPLTIEAIAQHAGVSRSSLFRAFQTKLGISPKEFLTRYRIEQACHLLKDTRLTVAAVAHSVGFESNLYFSKVFHKYMHKTPTDYRHYIDESI
ncbi:MAG: helix-turn-helix domain-containing protein [Lachnospiraceae bacterium]